MPLPNTEVGGIPTIILGDGDIVISNLAWEGDPALAGLLFSFSPEKRTVNTEATCEDLKTVLDNALFQIITNNPDSLDALITVATIARDRLRACISQSAIQD